VDGKTEGVTSCSGLLVDGRLDGLHDGVEEGKRDERLIDGTAIIVDGLVVFIGF
jgi:hypothetical protein